MKNVLKNLLGVLGLIFAIGLSLFALINGERIGLSAMKDAGIASLLYSGVALLGLILLNILPKFGGVLMILSGIVFIGKFNTLGLIASIPLIISGILGMGKKKRKKSDLSSIGQG
ncbi:hypothetical protein P9265_16720 [Schinkia azotoformans]|uniref:hypothetical protein n=1 Tax=Schinkia azotoformans TaxID=1454 RepID=UPI002E203782|nr:hypothetical protein [Schinkia azotoformans]